MDYLAYFLVRTQNMTMGNVAASLDRLREIPRSQIAPFEVTDPDAPMTHFPAFSMDGLIENGIYTSIESPPEHMDVDLVPGVELLQYSISENCLRDLDAHEKLFEVMEAIFQGMDALYAFSYFDLSMEERRYNVRDLREIAWGLHMLSWEMVEVVGRERLESLKAEHGDLDGGIWLRFQDEFRFGIPGPSGDDSRFAGILDEAFEGIDVLSRSGKGTHRTRSRPRESKTVSKKGADVANLVGPLAPLRLSDAGLFEDIARLSLRRKNRFVIKDVEKKAKQIASKIDELSRGYTRWFVPYTYEVETFGHYKPILDIYENKKVKPTFTPSETIHLVPLAFIQMLYGRVASAHVNLRSANGCFEKGRTGATIDELRNAYIHQKVAFELMRFDNEEASKVAQEPLEEKMSTEWAGINAWDRAKAVYDGAEWDRSRLGAGIDAARRGLQALEDVQQFFEYNVMVLDCRMDLAHLLILNGEMEEAREILFGVLGHSVKDHTEYHGHISRSLRLLSLSFMEMGDHTKAEIVANFARDVDTIVFGKDHVYHARDLSHLASVYRRQGRPDEAIAHYREAIKVRDHRKDRHNRESFFDHISLGEVLEEQGRLDESIEEWKRALSCKWDLLKRKNPRLKELKVKIGTLKKERKRRAK